MITVKVEPDGKIIEFDRLNTVLQLLNRLDLRPDSALIIRDGALLTPDRRLYGGDMIEVRKVASRG